MAAARTHPTGAAPRAAWRLQPALPPLPPGGRSRELLALVALVALAGTATLALGVWAASAHEHALTPQLFLVLVATLLTDVTAVEVRRGRHSDSYSWAEANVVLGLALLHGDHLLLTTVAVAIAYLATGPALLKWVHNVASYAVGLGLALLAAHAVDGHGLDRPVRQATALLAGAAAFTVWNTLSTDTAVALATGARLRDVVAPGLPVTAAIFSCNVTLALVTLSLAGDHRALLLIAPVATVVPAAVNRWYLRVLQDRRSWQSLERAARELTVLDERQLLDAALDRAAALLSTDAVQLRVAGPDGQARTLSRGDAAACAAGPLSAEPAELSVTVSTVTAGRGPATTSTTAVVPVGPPGARQGWLAVGWAARVRVSERERSLLHTFAGMLSVALSNARLHAQVQAQARLHEQAALHDPLTGLANRALLRTRVQEALDGGAPFGLLVLDLDGFKPVNDVHGHAVGDEVLRRCAQRMLAGVRGADTVARLGGDEFAVVVRDAAGVAATAERLRELLSRPVDLDGLVLEVGASVGTAAAPADGRTVDALLGAADARMYAVKSRRGAGLPRVISLAPRSPAAG